MEIFDSPALLQKQCAAWKKAGQTIALVPTMGYLHEGHLSLIRLARQNGDRVVVSIFVNPTQFGPTEDLDKYPRDFQRDAELCEKEGVDAIFHPEPAKMYDPDFSCWVQEESLSKTLCGAFRPIHFRGVCTVCLKLFHIAMADVAVFGRKDAQQLLVIQRMVRDLNVPIRIIPAPLVREADGLARSSRNKYLSADERVRALSLSRGLSLAKAAFDGGQRDPEALKSLVRGELVKAGADPIDYVDLMDRNTLRPAQTAKGHTLLAIAAYIGKTRLIDNLFLDDPADPEK
jgi:pantoate--beta-alanine ligase